MGTSFISTSEVRPQDGCAEILQIHKREVPLPQRGREGTSGILRNGNRKRAEREKESNVNPGTTRSFFPAPCYVVSSLFFPLIACKRDSPSLKLIFREKIMTFL